MKGEFDEGLLKGMQNRLISVLKDAAQDEGDDSMPEDTLWRLLIFFMQEGSFATLSNLQEVFISFKNSKSQDNRNPKSGTYPLYRNKFDIKKKLVIFEFGLSVTITLATSPIHSHSCIRVARSSDEKHGK